MTASISVHGFAECAAGANALAAALSVRAAQIEVRTFPDGESLVTAPPAANLAVVYRPLHQPNPKLFELALAAAALRGRGAQTVLLVAPYLAYMRQDMAFAPGQAVSQRVLGALIAQHFDGVIAVAPHLHRTHSLETVFAGRAAIAVQPDRAIADLLRSEPDPRRLLIGPDEESEPLVHGIASAVAAPFAVAAKQRWGDREVDLRLPSGADLAGHNVVLVDDMVSTGVTLVALAEAAIRGGASRVDAIVCHALFGVAEETAMRNAGIRSVRSCDGIEHATNAVPLARSLAEAVLRMQQQLQARF